jgi:hypothetical protein
MSQREKQSLLFKVFHPFHDDISPNSVLENSNHLSEIKVITDNDLKLETILIEEFRYRADNLKLATSEFTTNLNLYFLFLGASFTGIGVFYQLSGGKLIDFQILLALAIFAIGASTLFFLLRFIHLVHTLMRNKAGINGIREYYIKYLQGQIPDISNVFRFSLDNSDYKYYPIILYFLFAFIDSFCFAMASFIFDEKVADIKLRSLFSLPSELQPYVIGLVVGLLMLIFHIFLFRILYYRFVNKYLIIYWARKVK